MLESIKALWSFYHQGKFSEMREYARRYKEAEDIFDIDEMVENYIKIFECFVNEKNQDKFRNFAEIYRPFFRKFLHLKKDHSKSKITNEEFVSEFTSEFMRLPDEGNYDADISLSKGRQGLNISWSIKL